MKGIPKKGKYWYKIYYGECPVCGKDKSYKKRVYEIDEIKLKDIKDRIFFLSDKETYDFCDI